MSSSLDFDHLPRSMSTPSYQISDTEETSWKRSVKRRHGSDSREDEKGNLFRDVPTSTRNSHAYDRLSDSFEMTHLDSVDGRFELQKPGKISREAVDLSDCGAFVQIPGSRVDGEGSQNFSRLANLTRCQLPPKVQQQNRDALSRKRNCYQSAQELDEQPVLIATYQEVTMLRKALKSERDALQRLHIDLEEERCASKTAADEAIAMIMRLQEEKSSALMEARQYQRVAEEKEYYSQQTIALLKDALLKKEYLFLSLQEQIHGCKEMLMRMNSAKVRGQSNFLESVPMKEKLLLIESHEVTSSSNADVKYQVSEDDRFQRDYVHQSEVLNLRCQYSAISDGRDLHLVDNLKDFQLTHAEMDREYLYGGNHLQNQAVYTSDHTFWGADKLWESETGTITSTNANGQSRNHFNSDADCHSRQEDTSVTILDRLRQLEERLDFVCQSQMLYHESVRHSGSPYVTEPEPYEWEKTPESPYMGKHWYNPTVLEHEIKCSSYDKPIMHYSSRKPGKHLDYLPCQDEEDCSMVHQSVDPRIKERKCREREPEMSKDVNDDDVGDSIHDVYEVLEIRESTARSDGFLLQTGEERDKSEGGSVGLYTVEESEEASMNGSMLYEKNAKFEVDDNNLSVEFSALNVLKSIEDKDVGHLKLRLQALEGERVFMKEAIESLRKENMELKLLREIAQQLRELKGDVKKAGGSETSCRLSFLSFLRGLMSFAGVQNVANTEGSGSYNSFHRNSIIAADAQGGGLRQVLNGISEVPKTGYVTREYKIKIEK